VRRTSTPLILALVLAGAVVGWLGQLALAATGSPTLTPPVTLVVALFAIAAIVLGLGWPIRQRMRGKRDRPVDPFYAMRVVVFAKATSLTGALLSGVAAGLTLYSVTRLITPVLPGLWYDVLTLAGAVAMLVAGLIVETWCRIPPEDHEAAPNHAVERR
jgi:drug/metabolite transporter (DMT)-like permease